jgi:hypothetical protein
MRLPILCGALALGASLLAWQGRYWGFRGEVDNDDAPFPPDGHEKTEFVFARLRYPSVRFAWGFRGNWATDYWKADRQFVQGVRRLTRIHVRSVEQVVDLDSDEIYNWPWIYAVEVGPLGPDRCPVQAPARLPAARRLSDGRRLPRHLGVGELHGLAEPRLPDRPVVDIDSKDPIFHVLYDLDERFPGARIQYWYSGRIYEKDGIEPRWRAVYDDKGRIMVAICHNMDLGDAWEWADHPRYPEHYASLAYRIGINYIIYAMTH